MDFKLGEKIARIAVVATIFLAILKLVVGMITDTAILVADGIHSLSDVILLIPALLALCVMQRRPSERFPFGYYRAENVATFVISIIILTFGVQMLIEGYNLTINPEPIELPAAGIVVSLISIGITLAIAKLEFDAGKKLGSQSLMLNAKESYFDILLSAIVIGSIVANTWIPAEGIGTIIIALFILKLAFEGAKESILVLMDAWNEPELTKELTKVLSKYAQVKELKLRKAGPIVFGIARVGVAKELKVSKLEELANKLREEASKLNVELIVAIEKAKKEKVVVGIPIKGDKVCDQFARAKEFLLVTISRGKVLRRKKIINPFATKKLRAGAAVAEFLSDKVDALIVKSIGTIAYHMLADKGVEFYKAADSVKECIRKFISNELKILEKPTKKKI